MCRLLAAGSSSTNLYQHPTLIKKMPNSDAQPKYHPPPPSPLLGTEWLEAQPASPDWALDATQGSNTGSLPKATLCLDISEFRRHLQRLRKLDDSINLSLNRSFVLSGSSAGNQHLSQSQTSSSSQCADFWRMLTASWLSREKLIRFCSDVVDRSVLERKQSIQRLSNPVDSSSQSTDQNITASDRKGISSKNRSQLEAEVYTAELKRRMIHDELAVESAIRKQTLQKFRARCSESLFVIPVDSPQVQLDPHPPPQ